MGWLTANCWIFGLTGQNWMLVAGAGLLIYVLALVFVRRLSSRQH